jgi:hypothetical protein
MAPLLNDSPASPDDLKTGVFFTYSTNPGDTTNILFSRKSVFAHPSFQTDAQKQADGTTLDQRYVDKIKLLAKPVKSTNDPSLTTPITFQIYTAADAPIPAIRNEELILLKAEALWFTNDHAGAVAELNKVRTISGKLPALGAAGAPAVPADDTAFINELLYNRRYSLMYEGGYRWIDLRRFGLSLLVPMEPTTHAQNLRFPIPQAECDGRPGEATCNITSTDPITN